MKSLPVLHRRCSGVGYLEAAQNIKNAQQSHVATTIPFAVTQNVCFLVSHSAIGHWKNALSDGMGVWLPQGTKSRYVKKSKDGKFTQCTEQKFISSNRDVYKILRSNYTNSQHPE